MKVRELVFYLNGEKKKVEADKIKDFFLLAFLRNTFGLTGTKRGCSEGDCGACTVVIGEKSPFNGEIKYKSVTSCIFPVYRIHGKHIITIEGLEENGELSPIQKAFVEHHAIQCGFCTPGMIMSFFALLLNNPNPEEQDIKTALSGNLCRCTGYKSIKEACLSVSKGKFEIPSFVKETERLMLNDKIPEFDCVKIEGEYPASEYYLPQTVEDAVSVLSKNKDAKVVSGGTDFFVAVNKVIPSVSSIVDLSFLNQLKFIEEKEDYITVGSLTTFEELRDYFKNQSRFLELYNVMEQIASSQIRNEGTVAGNIANASPIADGALIMLALDAVLVVKNSKGEREIPLRDFYLDYKKTLLEKGDLITALSFSKPEGKISFLKTSKRKAVDIATVNSCFHLEHRGTTLKKGVFAFGGVYPYPLRIFEAEKYVEGKKIDYNLVEEVANICVNKVKPISDVRGSEEFRKTLVKNHVYKHFLNLFPEIFEDRNG